MSKKAQKRSSIKSIDCKKRSLEIPLAIDKMIEAEAIEDDRSYIYIVRQILTKHYLK